MKEDKCCGDCYCFRHEDVDGYGCCYHAPSIYSDDFRYCGDDSCDNFVSRKEMRHHMAVLLQYTRWIDDFKGIRYIPDAEELEEAVRFAYKYIRLFSDI